VMVTPNQAYAPRLVSKLEDGKIVTPSMEHLWPYISEDEIKAIMESD
jgi:hypothetical protein